MGNNINIKNVVIGGCRAMKTIGKEAELIDAEGS